MRPTKTLSKILREKYKFKILTVTDTKLHLMY